MLKVNLKSLLLLITIFSFVKSETVYSQYDSTALMIVRKMSSFISDLNSCSYKLETQYDVFNYDIGLVKHSEVSEVWMKGSNKFFVKKRGDKGEKDIYYDGWNLTSYSYNKNQYATAPAPATTMETIEEFSKKYGIEFPAADVFYPDLAGDIMNSSRKLYYLGITEIEGTQCFHIAWKTDKMIIQLWIEKDKFYLPAKMSIVYSDEQGSPQYEAVFKDWVVNPVLPDGMFDFSVPPSAVKIRFSPSK
ncbi:MAG: DUF2092 domain-containing protein [Ignavibacteria bacterium]|nr:DUF2092 domain-containing protein [Ignavibacteria bacterium]